jgi:hypothetical protein
LGRLADRDRDGHTDHAFFPYAETEEVQILEVLYRAGGPAESYRCRPIRRRRRPLRAPNSELAVSVPVWLIRG